jgi:hypothetical protein
VNRFEAHETARARRAELIARIERFIDGSEVSLESAGLIEVGLDDAFPDNDRISETVLMLASYRPGGGEFLYDEDQMRLELVQVLSRLRQA